MGIFKREHRFSHSSGRAAGWNCPSLSFYLTIGLLIVLSGCTAASTNPTVLPARLDGAAKPVVFWTSTPAVGQPSARPVQPAAGTPAAASDAALRLTGLVVDLDGKPIAGAQVSSQARSGRARSGPATSGPATFGQTTSAITGPDGWFSLDAGPDPQWVTVRHPNFISRTRASSPQSPTLFRLTPDDGKTISLLFTGDVMFGRRFFDPNEDGDLSDGLLPETPTVQDHLALIEPVRPLLENADLTLINFESAISDDPSLNYLQARPADFNQEKDYVYASSPNAITALRQAGVDIIGTANNHVYDMLEKGVQKTLQTLKDNGFAAGKTTYGSGLNQTEAWTPALTDAMVGKFGFTGCTSIITGLNPGPSYTANDRLKKGGAAGCDWPWQKSEIEQIRFKGDMPIVSIHAGFEYSRDPSELLMSYIKRTRSYGVRLLVSHHTHVISGLDWDGQSLAAYGLGNFIFDQTLWPTFESMVLVVHVRDGAPVHAYTEPLIIENYVPVGVVGDDAEYVAREVMGRSTSGFVIENGSVESDFNHQSVSKKTTLALGNEQGAIRSVPKNWWLSGFTGTGKLRFGRNLLWVGDFENEGTASQTGINYFWTLSPPAKEIGSQYAYEGKQGVHLERGAGNQTPVVLSPSHRILVAEGDEISLNGMGRSTGSAKVELQLSWYQDTKGSSSNQTVLPLRLSGDWAPFTLNAVVPKGVAAVGIFLKLYPPESGSISADFDNLRLIRWAPQGAQFSPLYDHYTLVGSGTVTFEQDSLPGWDLFEAKKKP